MARMNRDAGEQVIGLLEVRPNDRVLQIGFGPGVAIQLPLECVPGGFIAGVDPSLEMVGQAVARNATALRGQRVDFASRLGRNATLCR